MADAGFWAVFIVFGVLAIATFGIILVATRYKRCASDEILVVYGRIRGGKASRCIHGGAVMVWPLIQEYKKISLIPMTISIPLDNALSLQNIRINVPSTFTVGVSTNPLIMNNAAERLLHLTKNDIEGMAQEIILGQLRLTVASLTIEQINKTVMRSSNSSVTTLVLNFTSWVSTSSTSTSSILLTNPTTSTASVRRLLLVRSTRLSSTWLTLSVMVQSVRQTPTESEKSRLLRTLLNRRKDRRLLKSTDVSMFNNKKQLVYKEKTSLVLKLLLTKQTSKKRKQKQCAVQKLLDVLLKWKSKSTIQP